MNDKEIEALESEIVTMFAQVFAVPEPVRDAITRQLEVILGGI